MSLRERLAAFIAADGPIAVSTYMDLCLNDPAGGYYATHPDLGAEGDFITAPHVSQMFGELLGLWAVEVWSRLAGPARFRLIELGAGDATMMTDVLRAVRLAPDFLAACEIICVETSGPLERLQRRKLDGVAHVRWVRGIEEIDTDAPVILLANEFLDCLPIEQSVLTEGGWRERRIGMSSGRLVFEAGGPSTTTDLEGGVAGAVREGSSALARMGEAVGTLVGRASGAGLFIDYGRAVPELGDTLQAVRAHRREGPLDNPGAADLTARVDFPAFLAAARAAGARTGPIRSQADFLGALGIEARARVLSASHPDRGEALGRQLRRLTSPDEMGRLFKVACVFSDGLVPPGFED